LRVYVVEPAGGPCSVEHLAKCCARSASAAEGAGSGSTPAWPNVRSIAAAGDGFGDERLECGCAAVGEVDGVAGGAQRRGLQESRDFRPMLGVVGDRAFGDVTRLRKGTRSWLSAGTALWAKMVRPLRVDPGRR
jgi:hypothetical protein